MRVLFLVVVVELGFFFFFSCKRPILIYRAITFLMFPGMGTPLFSTSCGFSGWSGVRRLRGLLGLLLRLLVVKVLGIHRLC